MNATSIISENEFDKLRNYIKTKTDFYRVYKATENKVQVAITCCGCTNSRTKEYRYYAILHYRHSDGFCSGGNSGFLGRTYTEYTEEINRDIKKLGVFSEAEAQVYQYSLF